MMRFTRSLRFRLTLSYVFFFATLLVLLGVLFRQVLSDVLDTRARDVLEEEWGAVQGYLRIEGRRTVWYADPADPEEKAIADRLRRVLYITEEDGTVMEVSAAYRILGMESPEEIQAILKAGKPHWEVRTNSLGRPYLVRSGAIHDNRRTFFMSIARPLADEPKILNEFTRNYFTLVPLVIVISSLLGWFMAGRALRPVNDVAKTAQRISGSSMNVQIPKRRAGDELDNLIESFNRMMERLAASFEQIRQFSTDVSHELRTPLTAIRGQLEVALFTARTTEQYHEAMLNALQDVERLGQIVKSLLLLSQAESGQLALQKAPFDLAALVRDVVEQFQIPADAERVALHAELPPECAAEVDRIQFDRLVSNLLSNAVKYTRAGGDVWVRLRCEDETAVLEVEDTGVGIPQDNLPYIFDRFYRVRSGGFDQGLGLGLSFVAWIVKAHGGAIEVESTPGKGTRFTVRLPKGAVAGPRMESIEYNRETA